MSFKGRLNQDHIKGQFVWGGETSLLSDPEITENSVYIVFIQVVTQSEPHRKRYINTPGVEFRPHITLTRWLLQNKNKIKLCFNFSSRSSSTTATGTPQWTSRPWTELTGWVRPSRSQSTASSVREPSRRGSCSGPRRRARFEIHSHTLS